jgi:predicted TPR repeat methyltransferase
MSFEWLERTVHKKTGRHHAQAVATELADRAGTFFRLGYTQEQATQRLAARIAWEYDPEAKHGFHKRPATLSDAAISKIVSDTYARRPG